MGLLAICICSSVKCLFISFAHFLIRLLTLETIKIYLLSFEIFFFVCSKYSSSLRYVVCSPFFLLMTEILGFKFGIWLLSLTSLAARCGHVAKFGPMR